jgi:hypothetical protein
MINYNSNVLYFRNGGNYVFREEQNGKENELKYCYDKTEGMNELICSKRHCCNM